LSTLPKEYFSAFFYSVTPCSTFSVTANGEITKYTASPEKKNREIFAQPECIRDLIALVNNPHSQNLAIAICSDFSLVETCRAGIAKEIALFIPFLKSSDPHIKTKAARLVANIANKHPNE